ncbi:MAG: ATP-binding cassette domain-containing protein [Acidimicrobiia bacterium]
MIEIENLSKRYGSTLAVDQLSFSIQPGRVTGFLGPNGSGKSTTMRMILGLDRPSGGSVKVDGTAFDRHRFPLHEVGALLEARAIHPGRSARNHLRWLADSNGIPRSRVDEVVAMVGLESVAKKRVGKFSLGMGQRLGIAAAMLGDPATLMLDEPVNGLDPEGILWVRQFLKYLASEGRAVFVSSHLMSEMALTADHLVVIGRGKLIADAPTATVISESSRNAVRVSSPNVANLRSELEAKGATVSDGDDRDTVLVQGIDRKGVGQLAGDNGITLWELADQNASLEEAFMELTHESAEYSTQFLNDAQGGAQ